MTTRKRPNIKKETLREVVKRNVEPGAVVSTDELMSYGLLTGDGYKHGRVTHGEKIWKAYDYHSIFLTYPIAINCKVCK